MTHLDENGELIIQTEAPQRCELCGGPGGSKAPFYALMDGIELDG